MQERAAKSAPAATGRLDRRRRALYYDTTTPREGTVRYLVIIWDDGEGGNVEHVAEHGLAPEEVEDVLLDPRSRFEISRSSGRPIAFGSTSTGRYILVAFEEIDESTVYPITAYEVPRPRD